MGFGFFRSGSQGHLIILDTYILGFLRIMLSVMRAEMDRTQCQALTFKIWREGRQSKDKILRYNHISSERRGRSYHYLGDLNGLESKEGLQGLQRTPEAEEIGQAEALDCFTGMQNTATGFSGVMCFFLQRASKMPCLCISSPFKAHNIF